MVVKNIFFGEGERAREDETVIWNTDTSHMNAQSEVCGEEGESTEETFNEAEVTARLTFRGCFWIFKCLSQNLKLEIF